MKVLISGGGTGGHIYPAIAIANKLEEELKEVEILFVGTEKGLESKVVPKAGYELKTITVEGFQRKISFENVKRVLKLFKGLEDARKIVKKFDPDIVIGTGGYVCGPVVFNAAMRGIPTVIHEQNAFPGITNKILARFVDKILISFEDAKKYFPNSDKVVFTGNPVRKEILTANKNEAKRKLGIAEDKKMLLCVGGSGGSRKLNDSMVNIISNLVKEDIQFIHVTGKNHYEKFIDKLGEINLKKSQKVVDYLDDMATALAACDLVICSAGAITLAEVTALGKPSIIIPKAYTAENHQEYNAKSLENKGAAMVILEKDLNSKVLNDMIFKILGDRKRLKDMEQNSKNAGMPQSIEIIYKEIISML
ncbi:UDP-N-acetylglucosamine-N-acetylmuramylpentapeptide N-acetylglucosamine transferase [Alkalithermobacter thermoalcaliphilus JW-YL-7 = DSM 7308]|uniref:UDP-N-acetylglucosamine--N-acetylmuramyl-(pentapeptide) pyrophosphoryl-undecaprenol N-acetylglucosamine transferase n=1 Tax=Alkalithermobacter thermoalcaliphilus JW-YL-7 = DSM 7308 TaxID=1121328 RepID=A0A150FR80_CLOPD|nr:UDP-N-acetylglucosamine--N-acetylmuramyl-(pentapeptide) pyrophosphoryl-undecaprenol N-acetylglucosamine transferase [[Clostridium] paradoxum JW-YL-7 = DSM 7308]SHK98466.1 UDP-N-acetylglucosamine-N-acetylmuramylpentapeptide N-acetylglucosamine transferase [[Clostridium] paradoxum JW-YL-7 = DSM 7308]